MPDMPAADPVAHDPTLLDTLRAQMTDEGWSAFVVPHADAFQSEYLPPHAERLVRLTGFTGSAGSCIVLMDEAAVFVDGRYTLQVKDEVDEARFTPVAIAETLPADWLGARLKDGDVVAYDPWLHTPAQLESFQRACDERGATLKPVDANPIDILWPDQPAPPSSPLEVLAAPFAPLSAQAKREMIARDLDKAGTEAAVLSAGDSIAWLLNVRADDVPYTPLVLAYAIIDKAAKVQLFIDPARINDAVRDHLGKDVTVTAPDGLGAALDALGATNQRVRVATTNTPAWIVERLTRAGAKTVPGQDPCQLPKAKKTPAEIDGVKAAHKRDGAALVTFLAWLEATAPEGGVTELSAAAKLDGLRAENDHFRGLSFPTISGAGPNGAIVHYRVTPESNRALKRGELYLVDSGAQYLDGTTDVTRTVFVGNANDAPSSEMTDRFTRVLKGHIAISTQVFPRGTRGQELDVLARRALWEAGIDYDHGTGHGVGTYLGVHEGPQGISKRGQGPELATGMVVSNEPGYYKEGAFGIRIENLVTVVPAPAPKGAERELLGFEPLTLAPIERRLIDAGLLTPEERAWVDRYHLRVRQELSPLLDEETRAWLERATAPL